jgi:hypothetical protein
VHHVVVAAKKQTKPKPVAPKRATAAKRADLGAPIDGFFSKHKGPLRAVLVELRKIIESTVPDAESSIKWGNPFYTLNGKMMIAMSAHKAHVNLILAGPPNAFADPHKRLTGEGKTGRHLKLTSLDELPRDEVRGWVKTAAKLARAK